MSEKIEVILVDVGNSSVKTTEVSNGKFEETEKWLDLDAVLKKYPNDPLIISSVKKMDSERLPKQTIRLTHKTPLPITIDYATPETLGADRIAAAVGANEIFPESNNVIVDLGTCMTIDLIDSQGVFKGGIIAPGLKMRMTSMANYTDQLPDISPEWQKIDGNVLGKSTKECLYSGSYWGIIHEINGVIQTLGKDFTSLNIILTGGDAHFFESNLKAHIFAGSKIVQEGLYRIWKYQE